MDALARALGHGVDHVQAQVRRYGGAAVRLEQQLAGSVLHIGQPIDIELEDLRCVLHTQSVTGAPVLVHPDLDVLRVHRTTVARSTKILTTLQHLWPRGPPGAT